MREWMRNSWGVQMTEKGSVFIPIPITAVNADRKIARNKMPMNRGFLGYQQVRILVIWLQYLLWTFVVNVAKF